MKKVISLIFLLPLLGTRFIQLLTQQLNRTIAEEHTNGTTVFFNFKDFKAA